MTTVAVAFAAPDHAAARSMIEWLEAQGVKAAPAAVGAARWPTPPTPAVLIWSRHAAADPKMRALARSGGAALLAKLDGAPSPRAGAAAIVDLRSPLTRPQIAKRIDAALEQLPGERSLSASKGLQHTAPATPTTSTEQSEPRGNSKRWRLELLGFLMALGAVVAGAYWIGVLG